LAEMENLRKRAARDVEQAHKYALEKFAQDLINVKDSLELGLQAGQNSKAEGLIAGTEATLQLLTKAFERANITAIDPMGQPFNPEVHEAMVTQESADYPANTVLQVVQKGYQLNNRLLRPARVIVSR
jgi:molecular chaperone GrpE